jgi:diguanylate cyclase (GGDEF)-like protein
MKKILLVDDSKAILKILENGMVNTIANIEILLAYNYKDAVKYILKYGKDICVAVIDLDLPDTKKGGLIDIVEDNQIKSIILSAYLDENIKKIAFNKKFIIDCISKDGKKSIKNVVNAVNREIKNIDRNVLLVDDSKMQLFTIQKILEKMNLNVTCVDNGKEAYELIEKKEKNFSLILTDYHMPEMDGMELTLKLREEYDKDELGIIILSSNNTPEIASDFLKIGANDYINKPYNEIEVITRINANLDLIDLFSEIKNLANRDFLTGLYNRRYFFEAGNTILSKAKRNNSNLAIGILDIDNFKKINDTYGHDIGDIAICEVSKLLNKHLRDSDLISRFGGEEFCILLENISFEDTKKTFEKIRLSFEENIIEINDIKLKFTVSIGIFYGLSDSLEEMIKFSDEELYACKDNGRNQIKVKI